MSRQRDSDRVAEDTARHLLDRAANLDAENVHLDELRAAAVEAGISPEAFDAAVAEWREARPPRVAVRSAGSRLKLAEAVLRNAAAIAGGYVGVAGLAALQRLLDAPWLVQKLTDPLGLALGALLAVRLRARTATILLGGLAVAQGAEFLMDLGGGVPAVHGFGAHIGLMIAGIAGVYASVRFRRGGPSGDGSPTELGSDERSQRAGGLTDAEADERFMDVLRLRRHARVVGLQLR